MKREFSTTLFIFGWIGTVMACSGPGTGEAISRSIGIGYYCAIGSIVLTLFTGLLHRSSRIRGTRIALILSILLTVLHPGIWINAASGDCGMLRMNASIIVTGLVGTIFVSMSVQRNRKPSA